MDQDGVHIQGDPAPGPPPLQAPRTATGIADQVRLALETGDLDLIASLLSPDVRWGAPGSPTPPWRNRRPGPQVVREGRAQGRRATVSAVEVHGDGILVGLRLEDGQARWQVLRVGPEGVNDIGGFADRVSAAEALSP